MKQQDLSFCKCGCGRKVSKFGNKFVWGHGRKGKYNTADHNKKISEGRKGIKFSITHKRNLSESHKGCRLQREIRKCICGCEKMFECIVTSKKRYLKGHSSLKRQTDESNKKRSKSCSCSVKKLWQNPEYVAKQIKARHVKPNKSELKLQEILNDLFPNQYKYVGSGEFILAGKNPDFINVNGQKKIIELFGEPFHKPKEKQQRIDLFARYGYQTLIIWSRELSSYNKLRKKLFKFNIRK